MFWFWVFSATRCRWGFLWLSMSLPVWCEHLILALPSGTKSDWPAGQICITRLPVLHTQKQHQWGEQVKKYLKTKDRLDWGRGRLGLSFAHIWALKNINQSSYFLFYPLTDNSEKKKLSNINYHAKLIPCSLECRLPSAEVCLTNIWFFVETGMEICVGISKCSGILISTSYWLDWNFLEEENEEDRKYIFTYKEEKKN